MPRNGPSGMGCAESLNITESLKGLECTAICSSLLLGIFMNTTKLKTPRGGVTQTCQDKGHGTAPKSWPLLPLATQGKDI